MRETVRLLGGLAVPGEIEVFDHGMIEAFLKSREFRYLRDQDGDFLVLFPLLQVSDELEFHLMCWFIVEGAPDEPLYVLRAFVNRRFAPEDEEWALNACNEWNRSYRWPKAFYRSPVAADDPRGEIVLESQLPMTPGIHQALFDHFTDVNLSGAIQFWQEFQPVRGHDAWPGADVDGGTGPGTDPSSI